MENNKKVENILKKGFTILEWKSFPVEIKQNELIVVELLKMLDKDIINDLCDEYPFIIKYLPLNEQLDLISNNNFYYLSQELQLSLLEKDIGNARFASEEVQYKFAEHNPRKLSYFDENVQRKIVKDNEFFLEFASIDIQMDIARKNNKLLCRCSNMVQCEFIKNDPNYYNKCSYEVKRKIIKLSFFDVESISIDTLDSYLSIHYDNLLLSELYYFREDLYKTKRADKNMMLYYINYLIANIEKKKM